MRLELAVPDVDVAAERLRAWAKSVGGEVARRGNEAPATGQVAPLVNPHEMPSRSVETGSGGEHVIVMRLPAAKVPSMEPVLVQVGAWRVDSSKPRKPIHIAVAGTPTQAKPATTGAPAISGAGWPSPRNRAPRRRISRP